MCVEGGKVFCLKFRGSLVHRKWLIRLDTEKRIESIRLEVRVHDS